MPTVVGKKLKLPFVLLNIAMTADGKIATANRKISSFGSRRDQQHLYELRATADAVAAGARTTDLNPVNLGPGSAALRRLRVSRGLAEYNLRIIVSGSGTVNPSARIFKERFSPLIVLTTGRASARALSQLRSLADEVRICGERQIDFHSTLNWLARAWGVKRLLFEGGGELNDALFGAGVVDELHLTICPVVFGGRAAPTLADGAGRGLLANATRLDLKSSRKVGKEIFLVYRVIKPRRLHALRS